MENLLVAWREFLRGKRQRADVAEFSLHLMDNIFTLHEELVAKTYQHGGYQAFKINDPKPRDIHKASVRDRLVHHAICRILYSYFDRKFIFDSYSCRLCKGTHRALDRFRDYGRIVSRNHTRTAWALKGDIRKFFASIDHEILNNILARQIGDEDVLWLLGEIVGSFNIAPPLRGVAPLCGAGDVFHERGNLIVGGLPSLGWKTSPGCAAPLKGGIAGLPLGNLTSQLLVNIYMNELDQFIKRELKIKYYIRYADDFVIVHESRRYLENLIPRIREFLDKKLKLTLHPDKVFIKTIASGVDFLGWVHFPHQRVLRRATKWRMYRRLEREFRPEVVASYRGLLSYGDTQKIFVKIQRFEN